jgi:hypothetical protein
MKVEIQKEWFSIEQCKNNPKKLYVFGDNLIRIGNGGQATIRPAKNTYGIATKRLPSMEEKAFFSDREDEAEALLNDIHGLITEFYEGGYNTIVLPEDGLGTGLSKMPMTSPRLYDWLNETLSILLKIEYNPELN